MSVLQSGVQEMNRFIAHFVSASVPSSVTSSFVTLKCSDSCFHIWKSAISLLRLEKYHVAFKAVVIVPFLQGGYYRVLAESPAMKKSLRLQQQGMCENGDLQQPVPPVTACLPQAEDKRVGGLNQGHSTGHLA